MLQIYNTMTRQKEIFKPIHPGKISMYVCGITVYDYCHIGHARASIAFDVMVRFLRSQGWDVNYVHNITDIDDKIIKRAAENGEHYTDLTKRFIDYMHEDEDSLGIARPSIEPRATEFIGEIIELNKTLIEKGHAYAASNGDVYYRVTSFKDYGKLTNKNVDELLAGARIEVDEIKEDPRDFVLWKAAKSGEPSWTSPWGEGRPGWHIECSAMSKKCCGDTFDIHGGGPDLPFPHHENEIAQSEAANGCKYVNYWMHAGAVRVDGEKMSKSLGNFFTIRDVLRKYHPEVIRFMFLSSHYRSPIDYSKDNLVEAKAGLDRFYETLSDYCDVSPVSFDDIGDTPYLRAFVEAMNDDFNTRIALAGMYDLLKDINNNRKKPEIASALVAQLKAFGETLGVFSSDPNEYFGNHLVSDVDDLLSQRDQAKAQKDYQQADSLRKHLDEHGVLIKDSPKGATWRMHTIPDVPWPEHYKNHVIRYSTSMRDGVTRRYIECGSVRVNEKELLNNDFLFETEEAKAWIDANSLT